MRHVALLGFAVVVGLAASAQAAVIGTDGFGYGDGSLIDQSGGAGWYYNGETQKQGVDGGKSSWNQNWKADTAQWPQVVGGVVQTQNSTSTRDYNSSNATGAIRASGTVFFGFDMKYANGASWLALSTYDGGYERFKFGATDVAGGKFFGLEVNGSGAPNGWHLTNIAALPDQGYRLVGEIDYTGGGDVQIRMWVNPNSGDLATPDLVLGYTEHNWQTGIRLGSGGTAPTTWDNVTVGTTFADIVPEPATMSLLTAASMGLLAARRRRV